MNTYVCKHPPCYAWRLAFIVNSFIAPGGSNSLSTGSLYGFRLEHIFNDGLFRKKIKTHGFIYE